MFLLESICHTTQWPFEGQTQSMHQELELVIWGRQIFYLCFWKQNDAEEELTKGKG